MGSSGSKEPPKKSQRKQPNNRTSINVSNQTFEYEESLHSSNQPSHRSRKHKPKPVASQSQSPSKAGSRPRSQPSQQPQSPQRHQQQPLPQYPSKPVVGSIPKKQQPKQQGSIIEQLSMSDQPNALPPSIKQLSQPTLPNSGAIDLVCHVEDIRFCCRSKSSKTFKSIINKVYSRLSWIIDSSRNQLRVTLEDVKVGQPHKAPSMKPKVTFFTSLEGDFVSIDPRSRFLKYDGFTTQGKPTSKQIEETEMQLRLIWSMIRKGDRLTDETEAQKGNFKVVSYQKEQNEQTLAEKYRNYEESNLNSIEPSDVSKWEIESEEEERQAPKAKAKNLQPTNLTFIQSIRDYKKYMMLEHPAIPLVSVGNIFHVVIIGSNDNCKCDCYLKKYYIESKWVTGVRREETQLIQAIYKQALAQAEGDAVEFKRSVESELSKMNIQL